MGIKDKEVGSGGHMENSLTERTIFFFFKEKGDNNLSTIGLRAPKLPIPI